MTLLKKNNNIIKIESIKETDVFIKNYIYKKKFNEIVRNTKKRLIKGRVRALYFNKKLRHYNKFLGDVFKNSKILKFNYLKPILISRSDFVSYASRKIFEKKLIKNIYSKLKLFDVTKLFFYKNERFIYYNDFGNDFIKNKVKIFKNNSFFKNILTSKKKFKELMIKKKEIKLLRLYNNLINFNLL